MMWEPGKIQDVAVIAGVILINGVGSVVLVRCWITSPMFFVGTGIILGDSGSAIRAQIDDAAQPRGSGDGT